MQLTSNLKLKKPEGTDNVNIDDLNGNADILDAAVTGKVDKVAGKALSTEDYTSAEKSKLAGIAAGANNYVHPATHPASMITQDTSNRFVTDAEKTAWNAKAGTSAATGSVAGLMSAADKSKLDGIAAGAQANTVTSVAGKTGAVVLTKGDVGLGSVDNFAVATQAQAEAATVNNTYMTPLRTKEFVDTRIRVSNGNFEYFNGTEWRTVSGGGLQPTKPRNADAVQSLSPSTYHTMLNVTGAGKLYRISMSTPASVGNQFHNIRITVDGVAVTLTAAAQNYSRGFARNSNSSPDYGANNSFDYFSEISFYSSLKIDIMQNSTSTVTVHASADYSLV